MFSVGSASDFEAFYRQHHPAILGEALRLTGNQADASDLTQDTFERAMRSYNSFQPGTNGRAWLSTILNRLFIDQWRRHRSRPYHGRIDDLEVPAPPPEDPPMWLSFTQEELREAISKLDEEARTLLEEHVFRRQTYARLARLFQLPVATVGTRLYRTRGKLRTMMLDRVQADTASGEEIESVPLAA
jgi:RNA polymerase sigma-70 factor, ECF subfamily